MCFSANTARSLIKRAYNLSLDNIFRYISIASHNGQNSVSIIFDTDMMIDNNDLRTLNRLGFKVYVMPGNQWVSYNKTIIEW